MREDYSFGLLQLLEEIEGRDSFINNLLSPFRIGLKYVVLYYKQFYEAKVDVIMENSESSSES